MSADPAVPLLILGARTFAVEAADLIADTGGYALAGFVETANAWRINGDTVLAQGIGHLVVLLARLGHYHGAAQLYGAATRSVLLDALVPELEATMANAREAIGDDAFRGARAEGGALSYQAAGDLACELITIARAQLTTSQNATTQPPDS